MNDRERDAGLDRREFLRLAGASIALAGLDGCTRMPAENILPYVDNRPELTPGVGQHYATAMCLDGIATGLIVESHEGRPTKIEGNPDHPASLGASGPIEQASILQLYDPDRAKFARIGEKRSSWKEIQAELSPSSLGARVGSRGERLRILIEPTSSPLEEELLAKVLERYPGATVHMYAPMVAERATSPLVPHHDVSRADVILAVDADFLASGPFHLRYARQFADNRRLKAPTDAMNRLYAIESDFTPTGSAADHRFAVRPRDRAMVLSALIAQVANSSGPSAPAWIEGVARDLKSRPGRSVVIGGSRLSAEERSIVDQLNGAVGATGAGGLAWHAPNPLIGRSVPIRSFAELLAELHAKVVDTLIVVGGNPIYASPAALALASLIRSVPNVGYVGLYENETARVARWFVPQSHYLESWGDARAYDGTLSIVQPLVSPLYESITPPELYAVIAGVEENGGAYALLRSSVNTRVSTGADAAWTSALRRGVVADTAFPPAAASAVPGPAVAATVLPPTAESGAGAGIDVVYSADPKVHDGSFSNNAWLQELPSPLTQLAWGNAALISPTTARRARLESGDVVTLSAKGRSLTIPVLVVPGHADDAATLHFGYGRAGGESVARGVGSNVYQLWPTFDTWVEHGATIAPTGTATPLVIAQTHETLAASRPVRAATLDDYRKAPATVGLRPERVLSLYPEPPERLLANGTNQWAMTIDLGTCIGCNACVIACQSENNIPVVGPGDARNGRIMHWMRIDRYFEERENEVAALLQPMLCQHCEKAPCEYVCPVEATVHSADGLNEMVYNRCVGTRFCSNNCPYKVRHFNWFDYNARLSETELMSKNPNVTVRERGVMEKCTFCVQRIREAEIGAGREGRQLRGSEVRTACQQACPTNAIVFGSLTEDGSAVVRTRNAARAYTALHELGTQPRVSYLARIRNQNADLPREG
ncbi:MAG TPA: 4Fe-4S dicluster domain-containing protein [Gemmatimonadaceae bacterium]|nr:4Fe-4S dicluster domain-containing protein [Gemmatimonadaceae bacterium]